MKTKPSIYNCTYIIIIALLARQTFLGTSFCEFGKCYFIHLKDVLLSVYPRTDFNPPLPIWGVTKLSLVVNSTLWQLWKVCFLSFSANFSWNTLDVFSFHIFLFICCLKLISAFFLYILFASNIYLSFFPPNFPVFSLLPCFSCDEILTDGRNVITMIGL